MKKILAIVFLLFLTNDALSQNQQSIKKLADEVINSFTWDIQKSDKGIIMFLDIPFLRKKNHGMTQYLSLTVAKNKSEERPAFISVILPKDIDQSNGLVIRFAKTVTTREGESDIELEKAKPERIDFENCNDKDCNVRIIGGYVTNEDTKRKLIYSKSLWTLTTHFF